MGFSVFAHDEMKRRQPECQRLLTRQPGCGGTGLIKDEDTIVIACAARIAVYDDLLSAPRVVDIPPQGVQEFIENIAATAYGLSRQQGGKLPYTVIREITENFIHAGFLECTVSILDEGNTLRFADQGPGIIKKDLVLRPGVSSATSKMKEYIRGVGSGFPVVKEYLSVSHGRLDIEDNAGEGVVVTISLVPGRAPHSVSRLLDDTAPPLFRGAAEPSAAMDGGAAPGYEHGVLKKDTRGYKEGAANTEAPPAQKGQDLSLSAREEQALLLLHEHHQLGPVDLAGFLSISAATATRLLQKLEQWGMVESTHLKKRILSSAGTAYIQGLLL